ncbi:hypothetical protein DN412_21675 [Cupriavidus lacunae]|uniref:Uncharacterized protein n=2 Tax=Cupriavidus TaxID=106589 RepID=A0A367PB29_CUPNE|nr:hypothetical protein DDK22_28600 [Cupriavidus necator]RDK08279.1 hypothetical protein DN412_21675 [Cupriavidus lacunae]
MAAFSMQTIGLSFAREAVDRVLDCAFLFAQWRLEYGHADRRQRFGLVQTTHFEGLLLRWKPAYQPA